VGGSALSFFTCINQNWNVFESHHDYAYFVFGSVYITDNNAFTGTLPSEIAMMTNLNYMNLCTWLGVNCTFLLLPTIIGKFMNLIPFLFIPFWL